MLREPNPEWSKFYATGQEIQRYLQHVADKYKLRRFMKFSYKCLGVIWNEESGKWRVEVEVLHGIIHDECDVLIGATGILNNWKWPDIPGTDEFKGLKVHSAAWPNDIHFWGRMLLSLGMGVR